MVGVTGFFDDKGRLTSMGIQCALCHSTVDDSFAKGIGRRRDGWANHDLNVGAIIALAPRLEPVAAVLGVDVATVRRCWPPGDRASSTPSLFLDGKAFRPDGKSGAVLIPPAFGLAGVNLHTWTGWGGISHWNAFVANLEMHGKGTFFDPRLKDAARFPVAARNGFGNVRAEEDLITPLLPALQLYQLALDAPAAPRGSFNRHAAKRGEDVFMGKGNCATCHVPRYLPSPAGTCTRARRSASTSSSPAVLPTSATGPHRCAGCGPTAPGVTTTTAVMQRSPRSSAITTSTFH